MNTVKLIRTKVVNIADKRIIPAEISIKDGFIQKISPIFVDNSEHLPIAIPGFVDAHVHIESSMMPPSHFAWAAVRHGTVATVSDPHEIANVCGMEGVRFMVRNAAQVPFIFCFGAPSCVPATTFETSGATLTSEDIRTLFEEEGLGYLSEMMNYPGVIHRDPEVMEKIELAHALGKVVDGHAPGLRGDALKAYVAAGIQTDHECFTLEEALEKISLGMKILIREGSAAKNYEALKELIRLHPQSCMFCSDDKHPDDLSVGHINKLCARAVKDGYDVFDILSIATLQAATHYGLPIHELVEGAPANFCLLEDLIQWNVLETYIHGNCVYKENTVQFSLPEVAPIQNFKVTTLPKDFLKIPFNKDLPCKVIKVRDGELITDEIEISLTKNSDLLHADPSKDISFIVVVNRYTPHPIPAVGLIQGFGISKGAIASTVAHDSHNLIAIGNSEEFILKALQALIDSKGGISCVSEDEIRVLPLPLGGLMTDLPPEKISEAYQHLDQAARNLGSTLRAPYMSLSFMALLVIPQLKMSDLGLFDGNSFSFVTLQND